MIRSISLENFKAFSEKTIFDLKDLTVLSGTNSSGKTTFIQALLLLKQTLENPDRKLSLDFGGRFIQLSDFSEMVFGKSRSGTFKVSFSISNSESSFLKLPKEADSQTTSALVISTVTDIEIEFASSKYQVYVSSISYKKWFKDYGIIDYQFSTNNYIWNLYIRGYGNNREEIITKERVLVEVNNFKNRYLQEVSDENEVSVLGELDNKISFFGFPLLSIPEIGLQLYKIFKSYKQIDQDQNFEIQLSLLTQLLINYSFQEEIDLSTKPIINLPFFHFLIDTDPQLSAYSTIRSTISVFAKAFQAPAYEIVSFLRRINYLGPYRVKPERVTVAIGTPKDIGISGENTLSLLWLYRKQKVQNKIDIWGEFIGQPLQKAVEHWLNIFELTQSFNISNTKGLIYKSSIDSSPGSDVHVSLADVGFGFSQVLPVLLLGFLANQKISYHN